MLLLPTTHPVGIFLLVPLQLPPDAVEVVSLVPLCRERIAAADGIVLFPSALLRFCRRCPVGVTDVMESEFCRHRRRRGTIVINSTADGISALQYCHRRYCRIDSARAPRTAFPHGLKDGHCRHCPGKSVAIVSDLLSATLPLSTKSCKSNVSTAAASAVVVL